MKNNKNQGHWPFNSQSNFRIIIMMSEEDDGRIPDIEKGTFTKLSSMSLDELIRFGEETSSPNVPSVGRQTPRFSIVSVALIDDFARNLYKINTNLNEMRNMGEILGGIPDSHDNRAKLNALTEVTKEMIMRANRDLRKLRSNVDLRDEDRLRLTKMTREFQLLMRQFQFAQKKSVEKCQEFVDRAQAIAQSNNSISPDDNGGGDNDDDGEIGDHEVHQSVPLLQKEEDLVGLKNEISYNQALIEEREQGIQEIEMAMKEVHEIFCDLGLIVGEQQGLVDNIEANMEESAVRTRSAVRELAVARDYRRRRGNICCIILLALFIFIMVLAIMGSVL